MKCDLFLLHGIFEALHTYWKRRVGVRISAIRCLFTVCLQEGLDIVAYARPAVTCHYFAESLDKKVMSAHNHKGESFQAYVCLIPNRIHEAGC